MHRYAVIGHPVKHSLSPEIHLLFAEQTHQFIQYDKIESPLDKFTETVAEFIKGGGEGFNITVPFKHAAYELADELDDSAKCCGSVNTVQLKNNKLIGYNTDGVGLLIDLKKNLKCILKNKRILLIGAGGAAQGVLPHLIDEQPEQIIVVNRTLEKAKAMIARFQSSYLTACSFLELAEQSFDLVINATTSSLSSIELPLPNTIFSEQSLSYDMMYHRDGPTAFVKWSLETGADRAADGFGMLIEQAARAFKIWRGVYPDTSPVFKCLARRSREGGNPGLGAL